MKKIIFAILLALPMTIFAQKIGHVNTATIVQGMSEYTALQTEIQNLQKQFQDELQRKQTDIQTKADAYEKEKATLSEALRTYRENQEKVMTAVQEIGTAEGFTYILDAASVPFIGATATDITDKVVAKLGAK